MQKKLFVVFSLIEAAIMLPWTIVIFHSNGSAFPIELPGLYRGHPGGRPRFYETTGWWATGLFRVIGLHFG